MSYSSVPTLLYDSPGYEPRYSSTTASTELDYLTMEGKTRQSSKGTIESSATEPLPPRYFRRLSMSEKVYMYTAAAEAILVLPIAFAVFGLVQDRISMNNKKTRTIPVYLAMFILARLFGCVFAYDALRARNVVQLVFHIIFEFCMLVYAILEIPQLHQAFSGLNMTGPCRQLSDGTFDCHGPGTLYNMLEKLMIVPPIVIGIAMCIYALFTRKLYVQFGWDIYKIVGASPELKQVYRAYQTLVALIKMLLFFTTAFCMAYIILVTSWMSNTFELVITILALPVSLLCMIAVAWAVRRENVIATYLCLVVMVVGFVYFVYKFASLWLPKTAWLYKDTKITMAVFSVFAIVILLATFINTIVCLRNFGKGLLNTHRPAALAAFSYPAGRTKQTEAGAEQQLVID